MAAVDGKVSDTEFELIGKTFTWRSTRGLCDWRDKISGVWIRWRLRSAVATPYMYDVEIMVKGSTHSYRLDEVVIFTKPDPRFIKLVEIMNEHDIKG